MTFIGLMLAAGGLLCAVYASRIMAGLLFAGAVAILLLPGPGGGTVQGGGPAGPYGFEVASRPHAAPEAYFKGENGTRLSLEDFRGQVVLLNIWATWCGPCRAEMPSLDRLQARFGGDGLRVVAVSIDEGGLTAVRRFYQQRSIRNLKLYADSGRSTVAAFNVGPIPTTFLIDRNGNVVGEMIGGTQWDSPEALELMAQYLVQ